MILALKFKARKRVYESYMAQEKQQTADIVRSYIAKVTGHRSVNFLDD